MEQCLLVLIVTPSVENAVVDWLLERDDIKGFSSMTISGHGTSVHSLTAAEQVAGRRRQVMFHLHLSEATANQLIEDVRQAFSDSGMHYWLMPLLTVGRID